MSSDESSPSVSSAPHKRGVYWVAAGVIGLLAINWVLAVARFQVNGLFSDQWNYSELILRGDGPLALFTWQHGPHRQGLALVMTAWIWEWSGWDSRVEALWGVAWMVVNAGLVLAWKHRLTGRLSWGDLWLPLAALLMRQFETVITVPILLHSVFPFTLLLAAAWVAARPMKVSDWGIFGVIGVVALFTGFGLFVGVSMGWVVVLRLARLLKDRTWREALGPIGAALTLLLGLGWFLWGYELKTGSENWEWLHWPWWDYPKFVVIMLAAAMDLTGRSALAFEAGSLVLIVAVATAIHASWRLVKDETPAPAWIAAVLLLTTGLSYAVFTAVGRVHLGVEAGEASRYTTLMLSVWLGLVAWAWGRRNWLWRGAAVVLGWVLVVSPWVDLKDRPLQDWPGTMGMSNSTRIAIEYSNYQKIEWLSVWEETGDWRMAEAAVPEAVHGQAEAVRMGDKIAYMTDNRLSFASEPETPMAWLPWWNPKGVTWVRAMGGVQQQWMAERALLLIDGREKGFLNLRLNWKAEAMPMDSNVEIRWGDHVGQMSYEEMREGVSIPAAPQREMLTIRSLSGIVPLAPPHDLRPGSFLVVEPTLSAKPEYAVRGWAQDAEGLWPAESFVVREGFHGWEEDGAFGWSDARLVIAARSLATRYLNVSIESRFAAVNEGPVTVEVDGQMRSLAWSADGVQFAIELDGARSHVVVLVNDAGARSPQDNGESGDSRKLALRINRLTLDAEPVFAPWTGAPPD